MKMLSQCFILLLIGGFVAPFSISSKVQDLQNVGGGLMISWEPRTMISSEDYPCTAEGLYEHPSNCSRFYRCVDFTRESRIFSRYLFECPSGMVFAKTINACVPGVCPEKAMTLPAPAEGQDMTADSGNASVQVDAGGIAGSMPDMPEMPESEGIGDAGGSDDAEDMVTTMAPASESSNASQPSGLPPVIDQDTSVVSPEQVPESMENCPGKYIQHAKYCNLFHLCDDPDNLFSCYEGTAFSTQRQMCRLYQFEESLCSGKEVFVPSAELFREAFQWSEVGVVPLDKNPVYNANPYVFTNIGELPEGFTHTKATFKAPTSSRVAPLAPVPVQDTKDRKKTRFSSLLGTFSSLISDSARRRPPIRKSSTRKSPVPVVPSIPKVSKKDKPKSSQKDSSFDFSDFDFSALLPYASLLGSSLSGLASAIEPSQPDSIAVSPHGSAGFISPLVSSSATYSPLKGFGESQSQFPDQGYQMGYIVAPSSFAYSPYSGLYPYALGSADASSFLRGQFASAPTRTQFQGVPFASAGSQFPYSSLLASPSASFGFPASSQYGFPASSQYSFPASSQYGFPASSQYGFPASSQYGFVYDPTRNSISPISIPSSYLSSLYGSLLGLSPYDTLFQTDDQTSEDFKTPSVLPDTETFKPEKGTDRLKLKESKEPEKSSTFQRELTKRYPFLFNTRGTSKYSFPSSPLASSFLSSSPLASSSLSSSLQGASPLAHPFEARNKDGDTFQVIPLSNDEVATLASEGLLDRAVTVGKDFSYHDLKNLNKGEVILATFPKK